MLGLWGKGQRQKVSGLARGRHGVEKLQLSPESLQLSFAVIYCPAVSTFMLSFDPPGLWSNCASVLGRQLSWEAFHASTLLPCGSLVS